MTISLRGDRDHQNAEIAIKGAKIAICRVKIAISRVKIAIYRVKIAICCAKLATKMRRSRSVTLPIKPIVAEP